jgi:hypothetical protein
MSPARSWSVAAAAVAALAAGCGGEGATPRQRPDAARDAMPHAPADPLAVPERVPQRATGAADPASARVIRAWLRELRRGHEARAARYFASPSIVQNGTPVLSLETRAAVVGFNASLPCGATAVATGSAGRFTIVKFRLTERVHGDCMGAAGQFARGAIRVSRGKIVEWYRLPDRPPARLPGDESPLDLPPAQA